MDTDRKLPQLTQPYFESSANNASIVIADHEPSAMRSKVPTKRPGILNSAEREYEAFNPGLGGRSFSRLAHAGASGGQRCAGRENDTSPDYARPPVVTEMQCRSLCFWPCGHGCARP